MEPIEMLIQLNGNQEKIKAFSYVVESVEQAGISFCGAVFLPQERIIMNFLMDSIVKRLSQIAYKYVPFFVSGEYKIVSFKDYLEDILYCSIDTNPFDLLIKRKVEDTKFYTTCIDFKGKSGIIVYMLEDGTPVISLQGIDSIFTLLVLLDGAHKRNSGGKSTCML
ncbi:hypothetical protein M0R04_05565 [Candidatus Dojkabacteria bacterium]|jgi:hypothetical protein|nr:hypothetical protein [Candidatus Dojkabacteria bacterium]